MVRRHVERRVTTIVQNPCRNSSSCEIRIQSVSGQDDGIDSTRAKEQKHTRRARAILRACPETIPRVGVSGMFARTFGRSHSYQDRRCPTDRTMRLDRGQRSRNAWRRKQESRTRMPQQRSARAESASHCENNMSRALARVRPTGKTQERRAKKGYRFGTRRATIATRIADWWCGRRWVDVEV